MLAPTSSELPLFVFVLEALGQKKNGGIEAIWGGQHRREAEAMWGGATPPRSKWRDSSIERKSGPSSSLRVSQKLSKVPIDSKSNSLSPGLARTLIYEIIPPSKRPELEPCGNMPSTRHFQDPGSRGGTGCSGPGSRGRNFSCEVLRVHAGWWNI